MKQTWRTLKKAMTQLIVYLKQISMKKYVLGILIFLFVLLMGLSFFKKSAINDFYDASVLSQDISNTYLTETYGSSLYTAILQQYEADQIADNTVEKTILVDDMTGTRIDRDDETYGKYADLYAQYLDQTSDVMYIDMDHNVTFTHEGDQALYKFAIDYYELSSNIDAGQISITINGEVPFYESQTLVLPSSWMFETETFTVDRYNNEIQPTSEKIYKWRTQDIYDYRGMHEGLFAFELNDGDEVTISYVNQPLLIGQIYYVIEEDIPSYEAYLAAHDGEVIDETITMAARNMDERSDPSIRLRSDQNPANLYYDTQDLILNVIYGESWENAGQSIDYVIDVETSGYYYLSFKYREYMIKDLPVFRQIKIDDEVPFDYLEAYAFPYTTSFINRTLQDEQGNNLKIYLSEGTHTITLEAVSYAYRETIEVIQYVMNEIQSLALSVKRYTSGGTDRYRDWDIEAYFPDAASDIRNWADILQEAHDKLLILSDIDEPAEIANLRVAATRLNNIADDINELPSNMVQFSDGDSSVAQILGSLMQNLMLSSMEFERFTLHGDVDLDRPTSNIFVNLWEGIKRLVLSFVDNPYEVSSREDNELVVWVNHPRQYIEIMQQLIDQNYVGSLKITLSQMPDQNKLILANASGNAPDVAIGVDHWIPYNFAIRDAALDLRQFSGYEELVSHFSKGAMIPYAFEDGMYGLPETQNFWVTYYRKDILSSIGIDDIPQTWDEIIEILPLLQSYGMNYYVPLAQYSGLKPFVATLPFIYQFGGDLYDDDGMSTTINDESTLEGIKLMSELFTLYNLPEYVGNFYNHFRYGLLPIGISDLSTYILLETAAVELDGLWGMDLHPGVYDEETGEINRYSSVGSQSSMIMSTTDYPEQSWDFLSWWMSSDVQAEFAFLLQSTYGNAYFWNSANLDAFSQLSMPDEYKDVILNQWDYAIEASRIPGAYMVEREISNAWTSIVFDNTNARQALDEAVRVANREILYKMAEFGYVEDGEIVQSYKVPSIYNIDDWLTEVDS